MSSTGETNLSLVDRFRALRRDAKAAMPWVRRREYRLLRRRFDDVVQSVGWTAPAATEAGIHALHPLRLAGAEEVCFFVSHAVRPRLKPHVVHHLQSLLGAGIRVVLILNTDLPAGDFEIEPGLAARLSGVLVRENLGFDFAAWAHAYALCPDAAQWKRLFLVNDSIAGPLDPADFATMLARVRGSPADLVALTANESPVPHLQSFFIALNASALRSAPVQRFFARVLSLPQKSEVIDVYETWFTEMMKRQGLRGEAIFAALGNDRHSSNDTSFRWKQLIDAGFPYIKVSVMDRYAASPDVKALVPADWLADRA